MQILLTGATGFIGSHLLERLLERGDLVRALVRSQGHARSQQAERLLRQKNVTLIRGSITDAGAVALATKGVDVVYHLGWAGRQAQALSMQTNVNGARLLLQSSVDNKVKRFIFTSSALVYGPFGLRQHDSIREEDIDLSGSEPRATPYIEAKVAIERMICKFASQSGLDHVVFRPGLVYGAGAQFADLWVRKALSRIPLIKGYKYIRMLLRYSLYFTMLKLTEQLLHIRDMTDALLLAQDEPGAANQTFNIAGNRSIPVEQIEQVIRRAIRRRAGYGYSASSGRLSAFDLPQYTALKFDIGKAEALLHYKPRVSLHDGIDEMVSSSLQKLSRAWTRPRAFRSEPATA